jgi:hypothetical protein
VINNGVAVGRGFEPQSDLELFSAKNINVVLIIILELADAWIEIISLKRCFLTISFLCRFIDGNATQDTEGSNIETTALIF